MAKRTMAQSMLSALHQLSAVEKQHLTQFESVVLSHKVYLEGLITSAREKFPGAQEPEEAVVPPAGMPPSDYQVSKVHPLIKGCKLYIILMRTLEA